MQHVLAAEARDWCRNRFGGPGVWARSRRCPRCNVLFRPQLRISRASGDVAGASRCVPQALIASVSPRLADFAAKRRLV